MRHPGRSRWRPARLRAASATLEPPKLERVAPNPRLHDPPPVPTDGEVIYTGRRAPLTLESWEALGYPPQQAAANLREFPNHTQVEVLVITADGAGPLTHYPYHSPTGFNWGYNGSGCAELARCILLHHHNVTPRKQGRLFPPAPDELPVSYQQFKAARIARLESKQPWSISAADIRAWEATQR